MKASLDANFAGVTAKDVLKMFVFTEERNYLAMSGPGLVTQHRQIAIGQWAQPSPSPAGQLAAAKNDRVCVHFSREDGSSQGGCERRMGHWMQQWNAPTSLTLRGLLCALRSEVHATSCRDIHDSLG
jgi:hypothetical protein